VHKGFILLLQPEATHVLFWAGNINLPGTDENIQSGRHVKYLNPTENEAALTHDIFQTCGIFSELNSCGRTNYFGNSQIGQI
jgi:hypothetical protein